MKHQKIENYIEHHDGTTKSVLYLMHDFISSFPGIVPRIAYNIPFYYRKGWLCYLNVHKNGMVEWAFTNGIHLRDENNLLMKDDRKQVKGLIVGKPTSHTFKQYKKLMHEAMLYDDLHYNNGKKIR